MSQDSRERQSPCRWFTGLTLIKPGPEMLVDAMPGCAGIAALIASPTSRGFLGAPSCGALHPQGSVDVEASSTVSHLFCSWPTPGGPPHAL